MTISRLKFILPFTLLFVLLAILWTQLSSSRSYAYSSGMVGEKIPSFSAPALYSSKNLTNNNLKGRVTLLNFWASWCAACRSEHAMLMKIKNTYRVPIYGIAFKDDPRDSRAMLKRTGNPYVKAAYDANGSVGVDFGIYATPETFVISPNGSIIYKQIGAINQYTWDHTIYPLIRKYQR